MTDKPAWLAAALDYIPRWLGYQMRATEQPGVSLAVAFDGEVVLEAALGHADLAAREQLTPRHRYRVASHSKSFTATGIMKLREAGRIKLDDTAGLYVAGLHADIANATIAQLLSHTAGIMRDGPECSYWSDEKPFLNAEALRAELALPPAIASTQQLKYSNHGFGLAGLVIEAITGEPYNVWIKREVVDAAGLTETTPEIEPSAAPMARGHSGKALLGRRLVFPGEQSTFALASATGFVSTAADLARFFAQLSPTADKSILSVASRREMSRGQWRDLWSPLAQTYYGLGTISGPFDGWDMFGHTGGFQGYVTRTMTVPSQKLTVSVLTNAVDGMALAWMDGAFAILKRFADGGAPTPELGDWTGRWWSVWGPTDLVAVGDRVLLASPGLANPVNKVPELTVSGDAGTIAQSGGFGSFGEPVALERDPDGSVARVRIAGTRLVTEAALAADLTARY